MVKVTKISESTQAEVEGAQAHRWMSERIGIVLANRPCAKALAPRHWRGSSLYLPAASFAPTVLLWYYSAAPMATSTSSRKSVLLAERDDRKSEERVVPGHEGSLTEVEAKDGGNNTPSTTGGGKLGAARVIVGSEQDESDPECENERKECHRSSQRSNQVDGRDSEPDPEVQSNAAVGLGGKGRLLSEQTGLSIIGSLKSEEWNLSK